MTVSLWTFIELFDLCACSSQKKPCIFVGFLLLWWFVFVFVCLLNCVFIFACGKIRALEEGVQLPCNSPTVWFYSVALLSLVDIVGFKLQY